MRKRVVLRADGSKTTGYGHFYRSLALAGYLRNDFDCWFSTYNSDNVGGMPSDFQFGEIYDVADYFLVAGITLSEYNDNFLNEIVETDIVVLDNYYYDTAYQKRIKDKGCKLVCIDDMHRYHMVCDLLLTVCPLERKDFSLEPYTEFRGGLKYAFLRSPFFNPIPVRDTAMPIRRLVIAMGGADAYNLIDKIIGIVRNLMPKVHIDVIVGKTVKVKASSGPLLSIHRNISAEQIVDIFDNVDLGIFPTSTVCMEAFSRHLPVIGGYYVDNQKELYEYCKRNGYISPIGELSYSTEEISKRLMVALESVRSNYKIIGFEKGRQEIVDLFRQI